jgi:two-component system, chemotaxis family, response regulator WspF
MKVAIVNGSVQTTTSIRAALSTQYSVIWTAIDAAETLQKCAQTLPDIILIDAQIVTRSIINKVTHVLLTSPGTKQHIAKIYTAIEDGADDVVDPANAADLLTKLERLRRRSSSSSSFSSSSIPTARTASAMIPVVAIGSSTGGPKALAAILSRLPADFSAAITIVQHLDENFSAGFVDWLSQQMVLPIRRAAPGDRLTKGTVLVAGTNDHLYMKPDLTLAYSAEPTDYVYRPSVDVFFHSLAQHWQQPATAILLTGMGRDGAEGLKALKQKGWCTIAQNAETCAVYGMPRAAVELNAATQVLSPEEISKTLLLLKS